MQANLFGSPVSYPLVALLILAAVIVAFAAVGIFLSEKGYGVIPKRGRALRLLRIRLFLLICYGRYVLYC